jgi:hypothetical protein
MTTYGPIIEELEHAVINVAMLSQSLNLRQVRVSRHPADAQPVDITSEYEESLRKASNALNKAVAVLKNVKV